MPPPPVLGILEEAESTGMANTRFVLANMDTPTKRLIQEWTGNAPLSLPLPPNNQNAADSGGEEGKSTETHTQGGARGSAPRVALGYQSAALHRALRGTSGILPLDLSKNV